MDYYASSSTLTMVSSYRVSMMYADVFVVGAIMVIKLILYCHQGENLVLLVKVVALHREYYTALIINFLF